MGDYIISKVFEQKFDVKKDDQVSVVDDTPYIQVRYYRGLVSCIYVHELHDLCIYVFPLD